MRPNRLAPRLRTLPRQRACGLLVPVAVDFRARLLGLGGLGREEAGDGLLIPRCASVHTCGMRFALDLVFLDERGRPLEVHRAVPPRRLAWLRGADAVLEVPAGGPTDLQLAPANSEGGEFGAPAA